MSWILLRIWILPCKVPSSLSFKCKGKLRTNHRIGHFVLQLDALRTQLSDLGRRMAGLEAAAHPSQEELERVKQLEQEVSKEERDLARVEKASAHLRKKVTSLYWAHSRTLLVPHIVAL
jgi:chromosome segregation ATPase